MKPELKLTARNTAQLGNAILRFRKKISWTQKQISETSGVKQPTISWVELGAKGTRLDTVFKLLAALDLELVIRKRYKAKY